MDERIDELTNEIANKIDLYMDDYLIGTFALLRRMTQTTSTSILFNSLGNIKYEILGILRKHFSKVYDEIKQVDKSENDKCFTAGTEEGLTFGNHLPIARNIFHSR